MKNVIWFSSGLYILREYCEDRCRGTKNCLLWFRKSNHSRSIKIVPRSSCKSRDKRSDQWFV